MSRAKVILQSEFPYNISARCINKEWFNIPLARVWEIMSEELLYVSSNYQLQIHVFVLMSNHFHLIASTPQANISQCMHQFMWRSSRRLTLEGNRINETYAGRHYKCILQHPNYFLNAYKYNYRNPIAVGLCERVEDYPYSTFQSIIGISKCVFPLVEDTTYKSDPVGTLNWLNSSPNPKKVAAYQNAVRHQYFKSKLYPRSKVPILSEGERL